MAYKFVTGSEGKFREVEQMFGVGKDEMVNVDLREIQELNPAEVISKKLIETRWAICDIGDGIMVEDTSLSFGFLSGNSAENPNFPGTLIKWFLKANSLESTAELAKLAGNTRARARTMIGLYLSDDRIIYGNGVIDGDLVSPRGENGFGWDKIFKPDGYDQTFAEMTVDQKNALSMRKLAVLDLLKQI